MTFHQFLIGSNFEKTNWLGVFSFKWKLKFYCMDASMSVWDKHLMFQGWKNTSWIIFLPLFFPDSLWFKELKPPALLNLAHCDYPRGSPWVYLNFTLQNFSCICFKIYFSELFTSGITNCDYQAISLIFHSTLLSLISFHFQYLAHFK